MKRFLTRAARPIEFLLGIFFIGGALLKSGLIFSDSNIDLFTRQIAGYGVLEARIVLESAALFTITIEMLLGLALLLALRHAMLSFATMQILLIGFSILIAYAWAFEGLEDCGCLGTIEMTPPQSILKNLLLMALGAVAWLGFARQNQHPPKKQPAFAVRRTLLAVIITAAIVSYANNDLKETARLLAKATEAGPYTQYVFDTPEGHFDLGKGEHIVALLNMECDHCMDAVPGLNRLAADPNLPPVLALCYEPNADSMAIFRAMTAPEFPMHPMGDNFDEFMSLLAMAPPTNQLRRRRPTNPILGAAPPNQRRCHPGHRNTVTYFHINPRR